MPGLQVDYNMLRREIGRFADSGRSGSDWDTTQDQDIEDALNRGLRLYYYPTVNRETGETYHWSFLEEDLSIELLNDKYQYDLPARFSRTTDEFVIDGATDATPLAEADDSDLRALIANEGRTGDPEYFAIRTRRTAPGDRSLREVLFYPIPTGGVTVTARMEIEPPALSPANPYPLGGAMHGETIIEACLVAAELVFFPESGPGIHHDKFYDQLLPRSVEDDRELTKNKPGEVWPEDPLDQGLDTLEVNKFYLMRVIGKEMNYGPHPRRWKHNQKSHVLELLRTGLRDFYTPQVLPGKLNQHSWSFLRPTYLLTLVVGQYEYDMPDDFNAVRGSIQYTANTNAFLPRIDVTNENRVKELLAISTDTFIGPTVAAFRVKAADQAVEGTGTRWEMLIAPVPSGGEAIEIPYSVNPYQLSDDVSLPMGGQPHAQTLIESCLAAAEVARGDGKKDHQAKFLLKLQASISHDEQATCAMTQGRKATPDDNYNDIVYGDHYGMDNHVTQYNLSS